MSDLISRQDAIDALEAKKDKSAKGDIGGFYNAIIQNDIDKIKALPSVQPDVPDKNVGKWIYRKRCKNDKQPELICPFCGEAIGWWDTRNFCANCGAKLEEPEDETNVRKPN